MTDAQIREALKNVYKRSPQWAGKVNRMNPDQVVAVYIRLKLMGLIKV
jgi:hypothetical protein